MYKIAGSILNAALIEDSDGNEVSDTCLKQDLLRETESVEVGNGADVEQEENDMDLVPLQTIVEAAL